ncbi:Flp family type IVb pilin [Acetobacter okinawensis]|uniref:Flp family type IVb pilin n=1 Tax=Acetobacter okinawensis TaxID=1076594 RepID=UPI001BA82729|nr:Flp family type IVb pilin [Acetobacter okinawensis]MBS0987340.1 Flp family type IVb pilin [Acetobacter okinawensis]
MKINKIKNRIGATAIEYGLLSALVAVVAVTGVSASGSGVSKTLCTVSAKIGTASGCSSASALSPADKMAQNSVVNNQSLGYYLYENTGASAIDTDPALTNNNSFSVYGKFSSLTPDFSKLSISGFKDSTGKTISNMSDLANALGVSSEYKAYQDAVSDYRTYEGKLSAESNSGGINYQGSDFSTFNSDGQNLENTAGALQKAIESAKGQVLTTGASISFLNTNTNTSSTSNISDFGYTSSNLPSGVTGLYNTYGKLQVSTPASNYSN